MARYTDKKLLEIAKQRAYRLEKAGLQTDALQLYKQQVEVLTEGKRGVSFADMNKEEKATLRRIANQFIKSDESTKTGIKQAYKRTFGKEPKNVNQALKDLQTQKKLGELGKARQKYGYDVEYQIHQDIREMELDESYHTFINEKMVKLSRSRKFASMSQDDKYNALLQELRKEIKKRG